ncbi:uncharacterized protein G2W53_011358 [Senna tora]|uniref:Uncharacterized protein n=1 Tax=Senna tora TaxID=362788 RepID=A0A834X1U0_9FABA|nr:uncharacterized protein G2W53_011358 [Senna tora]
MVTMLSHAGYNATLRISKWENTKRFPGGSHEYIEIMMGSKQPTRSKKQNPIFLVELELRDQFKMGRASEEYNKMVSMLPEFFVGKPEYLTGIIRVMCSAAKKSMKEKKIHMGPWRKSSFMQMKWSASVSASASTLTSMTSAVSFNKNKNWNLEFGKESLKITATTTTTTTTNNIALSSFPLRQQIQPNCLPISEAPFVVVS